MGRQAQPALQGRVLPAKRPGSGTSTAGTQMPAPRTAGQGAAGSSDAEVLHAAKRPRPAPGGGSRVSADGADAPARQQVRSRPSCFPWTYAPPKCVLCPFCLPVAAQLA